LDILCPGANFCVSTATVLASKPFQHTSDSSALNILILFQVFFMYKLLKFSAVHVGCSVIAMMHFSLNRNFTNTVSLLKPGKPFHECVGLTFHSQSFMKTWHSLHIWTRDWHFYPPLLVEPLKKHSIHQVI
jgi:hypothetical protein